MPWPEWVNVFRRLDPEGGESMIRLGCLIGFPLRPPRIVVEQRLLADPISCLEWQEDYIDGHLKVCVFPRTKAWSVTKVTAFVDLYGGGGLPSMKKQAAIENFPPTLDTDVAGSLLRVFNARLSSSLA
jgi:hypothetical protein